MMKTMEKRQEAKKNQEKTLKRMMAYQKKAEQLLGFMGDTGYGEAGTKGMFPVHLHLGIYIYPDGTEMSINPYAILKYAEQKKLRYRY